jgi:hypothetical protein
MRKAFQGAMPDTAKLTPHQTYVWLHPPSRRLNGRHHRSSQSLPDWLCSIFRLYPRLRPLQNRHITHHLSRLSGHLDISVSYHSSRYYYQFISSKYTKEYCFCLYWCCFACWIHFGIGAWWIVCWIHWLEMGILPGNHCEYDLSGVCDLGITG